VERFLNTFRATRLKNKLRFFLINLAISYIINLLFDIADMTILDTGTGVISGFFYLIKLTVVLGIFMMSEEWIREKIKAIYGKDNR
jgi:hypothetical protein